jgi:hypothetical protein
MKENGSLLDSMMKPSVETLFNNLPTQRVSCISRDYPTSYDWQLSHRRV